MNLQAFPARHVHNPLARRNANFGEAEQQILAVDAVRIARAQIGAWPGYARTPLHSLPGHAGRLGLRAIRYKDEGGRFGLGSFKALGGSYAVLRLIQERLKTLHGIDAIGGDILAGRYRQLLKDVTVTTATDGNHGRAVAWGAGRFGCRCVIYLHERVSASREASIAKYGAEIRRVVGHYDDSVRQCAADAAANGWLLVADTAGDEAWRVPALVMQGYGVLALEVLEQTGGMPFSHVFVQGGVGALAASVAAVFWQKLGELRPRIIVVEPERADCIFRTVEAGRPTPVPGGTETFMACLAAGEISRPAWQILRSAADDVLTLPDEAAVAAMRRLAEGAAGDRPIVAGESGCAAFAGLVSAALDPELREVLELGSDSSVLVIGSEGATDPETYERIVGQPAEAVEPAN
jgi:diaminopropionate ammonia-lyase